MGDLCTNELPGSIVETYVLAIELVGNQVKNSPQTISRILNNPEVQKKIKEALEKRLGELQTKALQGRPIDGQQALQEVQAVFTTDAIDAIGKAAKSQLEKSSKYQQLKSSLDGLACKFKESPVGALVNDADGVLLLVATGIVLAGAVGMYIVATNDVDKPLAALSKLAELPSITLGKVDLGLTDVVLKPSEKKYDAGIYAKISKWKAVESAELKIVAQTKDERVAAIPISVETKVKIHGNWFNTFGATYEPIKGSANFSLGIIGKEDSFSVQVKANFATEDKKTSYGGTAKFGWQPFARVPMDITGGLGVTRTDEMLTDPMTNIDTRSTKTDLNINLGLKINF